MERMGSGAMVGGNPKGLHRTSSVASAVAVHFGRENEEPNRTCWPAITSLKAARTVTFALSGHWPCLAADISSLRWTRETEHRFCSLVSGCNNIKRFELSLGRAKEKRGKMDAEGFWKTEREDSGLEDQSRAYSLLLESLVPLLADPSMGIVQPVESPCSKEQAKVFAIEWKSRIDVDVDPANAAKPLEIQAFSQIVATFEMAAEFLKDDLCKLVLAVSWRKQIPKLCGALGLIEKMPNTWQRREPSAHALPVGSDFKENLSLPSQAFQIQAFQIQIVLFTGKTLLLWVHSENLVIHLSKDLELKLGIPLCVSYTQVHTEVPTIFFLRNQA